MNDQPEISATKPATPKVARMPKRLLRCFLFAVVSVVATIVLFSLRDSRRPGGDSDFAEDIILRNFDIFYLRSPLTIYFNQALYHRILKPRGWSAADPDEDRQWRAKAVGLSSAMGGGLFVATLVAICPHWLFLLFNLTAPFMFIFLGHVEHYAWVNALLVVYFLAIKRHLENGAPVWVAFGLFLLAASFHMLVLFYAPSFLFVLAERNPATGRWRWRHSRHQREALLVMFIAWAVLMALAEILLFVAGLDNGLSRLVPVKFPVGPSHYRFTLFSLAHLKMWLYFHWMSSPLGLVLLILLIRSIRTQFDRFLLVAIACGFLWTWMWHPDRGQRDWDLFANLALPLNILVGLLLSRLVQRFLPAEASHA